MGVQIGEFPRWFRVAGLAMVPGAAMVARLVWEYTYLQWHHGPMSIGYSLLHGPWAPLALFGIAALLFSGVWAVAAIVLLARTLVRSRRPSRLDVVETVCACLILAIWLVPGSRWFALTVEIYGPGPAAADHVEPARRLGDTEVLELLEDR